MLNVKTRMFSWGCTAQILRTRAQAWQPEMYTSHRAFSFGIVSVGLKECQNGGRESNWRSHTLIPNKKEEGLSYNTGSENGFEKRKEESLSQERR